MFDCSPIQIAVLVVLVVFGLCGNIGSPVLAFRTNLGCSHIALLAALDFAVTLIGPGVMLMSLVIGPNWLEHCKPLCQSLTLLSTWTLLSCLLVLFFLALFCQKAAHDIYLNGRRRFNRKENVFLAVCLLTGLIVSLLPFFGWSAYNGVPQFCTSLLHYYFPSISNFSLFYLLCSFLVLFITLLLSVRAAKYRRSYPIQLFWERHKLEARINDPEVTTTQSDSSTSFPSRFSVKSRRSLQPSVFSGRRSGKVSSCNSPMVSRRNSQQSCLTLEGLLLEIAAEARKQVQDLRNEQGAVWDEEPAAPRPEEMVVAAAATRQKDLRRTVMTASNWDLPRDPFVISSRVPYYLSILAKNKKIFQNPKTLPNFRPFQKQLSLSRFLFARCCVSLACWLPLYVTAVLHLSFVHYPRELPLIVHWLLFAPSSISPLLFMCDAGYRQVCRRAAYSLLKICSRQNSKHVGLLKSQGDVEYRVEETLQVQLRNIIHIEPLRR